VRTRFTISIATLALLAGSGVALGQGTGSQEAPSSSGTSTQKAPSTTPQSGSFSKVDKDQKDPTRSGDSKRGPAAAPNSDRTQGSDSMGTIGSPHPTNGLEERSE